MNKSLFKLAMKYGASDFGKSDIKGKRYYVIFNNKIIHFGSDTGETYIDHFDSRKRDAWYKRHSHIYNKQGQKVINLKSSASYWSAKILWPYVVKDKLLNNLTLEEKKERFKSIVNKL